MSDDRRVEVCASCHSKRNDPCEYSGHDAGEAHVCPSYNGGELIGKTVCPECGEEGEWVAATQDDINSLYAEAWNLPDPTRNPVDVLNDIHHDLDILLQRQALDAEVLIKWVREFQHNWPKIRGDVKHILTTDPGSWTLSHPLSCRVEGLENCKATNDVTEFFNQYEPRVGRWELSPGKNGGVVIPNNARQ